MISLVVTGGQSGSDQAGWRAARAASIPTGGWMPKGYHTEDGPRPEFAELYGAKEHEYSNYPPRTRANVNACDVLLWFGNPYSPGGRLTLGICDHMAVLTPNAIITTPADPGTTVAFLRAQRAAFGRDLVVMVAGNRESSKPGIGRRVERYLTEVFRLMREDVR